MNSINTSLNGWLRYYEFLEIIKGRYAQNAVPYVETVLAKLEKSREETTAADGVVNRPVSKQELEEIQGDAVVAMQLHLDVESFYVFANVLLDRIASMFRYYFYSRANWNHHQLMTNLRQIVRKRQFHLPDSELLTLPENLHTSIVKYRNTRVEHVEEPRLMFATMWGADKKVKISPTFIYPTPDEAKCAQEPTDDIDEMFELLDRYMTAMLDFFVANENDSIVGQPSI